METTQKVCKDYRITIPKNVRDVMGIDVGDYVIIEIKKVVKRGTRKA